MPTNTNQQEFQDTFKTVKSDMLESLAVLGIPKDGMAWYERNIEYNLPGGKLNRGVSILDTVQILRGRELTQDETFKSIILGWCVELMQAYFLVVDDLTDGSLTRRGQACYYRVVGDIAVNDGCMLQSAIFVLIKKYFRQEKYYVDLVDLILDTVHKTEAGQMLDTITGANQNSDRYDISKFSLDKYNTIVRYKTAYYSFYLPVAMGMILCDIPMSSTTQPTDPYALAADILLPLGEYFQVQDDYLDAFSPPEHLGKIGTDIIDGKCSWCVCTALSLASEQQKQILRISYGKGDVGGPDEKRVKEVYEQLELPPVYVAYEDDVAARIQRLIERVDEQKSGLKKQVFTSFFNKIYKRSK